MEKTETLHPVTRMRLAVDPKLSTRQVAERAGVDRTSLIKVERGQRDRLGADSCRALVAAFPQLDLDELLGWKWAVKSKRVGRKTTKPAVAALRRTS
jgi:transcriptional regulator with XRE-family HTH domain